jgi:hypothetical protein
MTDIVYIMAGGIEDKWGHGSSRYTINVYGQALLLRTVKQFKEVDSICVVSNNPDVISLLKDNGVKVLKNVKNSVVSSIYANIRGGYDRYSILLGDVLYSNSAVQRVLYCNADYRFFGNKFDIFALSFNSEFFDEVVSSLHITANNTKGNMWNLYRETQGVNPNVNEHGTSGNFEYIIDNTRDFDYYTQYEGFLRE